MLRRELDGRRPLGALLGSIPETALLANTGGSIDKGSDMTELVKCDSCGVDTPATGFCRVDGFTDSDGFWRSGSFNVAVGLCERCDDAWSESITPVNFDRMAWINDRVNEAHSLAGGHALACAICATVDEFAELLAVHYAGVEE